MAAKNKHGFGSVQSYATQSGTRWALTYGYKDQHGKYRQKRLGGFLTKAEAEKAAREIKAKKDHGTHLDPSKATVEEYVREEYLPLMKKKGRAPVTLDSYETVMNTWVLPSLGHLQVQKVDWLDVQRMIDSLDRLSPATVRLCMTLLRAMFQLAVDDKVINENPAASARLVKPAGRPSTRTPWSLDEAKVFIASLKPDQDDVDLAFLLMAVTGLRRAEAAGLRWGDIDLDACILNVQRSVSSVKGELIVSDGGKTANAVRMVGLVPEVRELLARHKMREAERFWANGRLFGDEGAVFATWTCTPRAPHTFSTRFQAAVKRAKVRPIPLHSLRHLAISQAQMSGGISQLMIGKVVGHSSAAVSSGYTHADAEVAQKVAVSMARVLN